MQVYLDQDIEIQPKVVVTQGGKSFNSFLVTRIWEDVIARKVNVRIRIINDQEHNHIAEGPSILINLWKDEEYEEIGQYTDDDIYLRIVEILGHEELRNERVEGLYE